MDQAVEHAGIRGQSRRENKYRPFVFVVVDDVDQDAVGFDVTIGAQTPSITNSTMAYAENEARSEQRCDVITGNGREGSHSDEPASVRRPTPRPPVRKPLDPI